MSLVRPEYIVQAAKIKYRTESPAICGAFEGDVDIFWSTGSLVALRIDPPAEIGRYVIDVEVKEIYNDGSEPKRLKSTLFTPNHKIRLTVFLSPSMKFSAATYL